MSVAPDAMALGQMSSFHHRFPVLAVAQLSHTPKEVVTRALHDALLDALREWAGARLSAHAFLRDRGNGTFDPVFELSTLPVEEPWQIPSGPTLEIYEDDAGARLLLQNFRRACGGAGDALPLVEARLLDPFLPPDEDFSLLVTNSGAPLPLLFQRLPHRLWHAHLKERMAFFQLCELFRVVTNRTLNAFLPWRALPSDSLAAVLERGLGTILPGPVIWNDASVTIESSFLRRAYAVDAAAHDNESFVVLEHPLEGIHEASKVIKENAAAPPLMMVEYGCVIRIEKSGVSRWVLVGGEADWIGMQRQLLRPCRPTEQQSTHLRRALEEIAQAVTRHGASTHACWAMLRAALAPFRTLGDDLPRLRPLMPRPNHDKPAKGDSQEIELVDKFSIPVHALLPSPSMSEVACIGHRSLQVWDSATGSLSRRYCLLKRGELDWLTSGAWSGDAQWIATVSASGCVHWVGPAGYHTLELHATTERESTRMALSQCGAWGAVVATNRSSFWSQLVHHEALVFDHRQVIHRHAWPTHLGVPRGLWFATKNRGATEVVVLLLGVHLIEWDPVHRTVAQVRDDVLTYDPDSHRAWVLGDAACDPSTSAICDDLRATRVVALKEGGWEEARSFGDLTEFADYASVPIRVTSDDICMLRAAPSEALFKRRFGSDPDDVMVASYGDRRLQPGRRFRLPWSAEARLQPFYGVLLVEDTVRDVWTGRVLFPIVNSYGSFGIQRIVRSSTRVLLWHTSRGAQIVDFSDEAVRMTLRDSAEHPTLEWWLSADGKVATMLECSGTVRMWSTETGEPMGDWQLLPSDFDVHSSAGPALVMDEAATSIWSPVGYGTLIRSRRGCSGIDESLPCQPDILRIRLERSDDAEETEWNDPAVPCWVERGGRSVLYWDQHRSGDLKRSDPSRDGDDETVHPLPRRCAIAVDASAEHLASLNSGLLTVSSIIDGKVLASHQVQSNLPWEVDHPTLHREIVPTSSQYALRFSGSSRFLLLRDGRVPCTLALLDWRSGETEWQIVIDPLEWDRFEFSVHGPPWLERFDVSDDGKTLWMTSTTRIWCWQWCGSKMVLQRIFAVGENFSWAVWDVARGVTISDETHQDIE